MIEYDARSLGMMVVLVSFLGFVLENLWLAATKGYMDNRNMGLPFLLGYGVIVICIYFMLGTPDEVVLFGTYPLTESGSGLYFAACFIIVSAGEIALGTVVERLCGFAYWNYEWIPLHLTKYTSVPTSLGFAAAITLFMKHVFPPVMAYFRLYHPLRIHALCTVTIAAMVMDFVLSFKRMYETGRLNIRWKFNIGRTYKDSGRHFSGSAVYYRNREAQPHGKLYERSDQNHFSETPGQEAAVQDHGQGNRRKLRHQPQFLLLSLQRHSRAD